MEIISQETIQINIQRAGRLGNTIIYSHVKYHGSEYTIMKIQYNNEYIKAVIDTEDFIKIKDYNWHYIANGYISNRLQIDNKKKELYLHNIVMGRLEHPGKGSKESIDHINRNKLDNRIANLRIATQSEQTANKTFCKCDNILERPYLKTKAMNDKDHSGKFWCDNKQ